MTDKKKDQSVSQVAEIFGCNPQTVRNWIASGRIKAYRLGGQTPGKKTEFRIPWAEIERVRPEWMYKPTL